MIPASAKKLRNLDPSSPEFGFAFDSELGAMAIVWSDRVIQRLGFGHATIAAARASMDANGWIENESDLPGFVARVVKRLRKFAAGKDDDFHDVPIDLSHLTEFQLRVVEACRAIGPGCTKSYGELAAAAGSPRAARAVGNVMRANRYPLVVPCHRVVGSDGRMCGFTSPQGVAMKKRLLARERK